MASEEVAVRDGEILRRRVEFFASTLDALLQDYLEKACANDRLGFIVACARLSQVSHSLYTEAKANCEGLIDSATEMKVATQAAQHAVDLVNRNGEQCGLAKETAPEAAPAKDRSQN